MSWMKRYGAAAGWAWMLSLVCACSAIAQSASVTIDDQPTTEQKLARINDLRRASRHDDAADLLQELIDGARFKLVAVDDGLYVDAELWARRELSRDPALLAAYRLRFTASAERALELAASDTSPTSTALREAYRRFGMTRPGLEAGLALSGLLLEAGDIRAAWALLEVLSRHPDKLDTHGRVTYLQGVCAALRGDREEADAMVSRLRQRDAALAERLVLLQGSLDLPPAGAVGGLVDAGAAPQGLVAPLWETQVGLQPGMTRSSFNGLNSLPVVMGEQVLINTGDQVISLDRASGQQQWAYPEVLGRGPGFTMNMPTWIDTRGVVVSRGHVFGVLGACRGGRGRGGGDVIPSNALVCLDPQTGTVVWSRPSGEILEHEPAIAQGMRGLESALLQTHFVGTPVAAQGKVFTLVRRTSLTGLQTTWLAAFDAYDGELQWFRHIALVQVQHSQVALRITPQLLLDGDTLYLCDQIAVAASIDVHSGAYHWLRVLAKDSRPNAHQLNLMSEGTHSPPVLTPSGLVVQLALNYQRLSLLDPANGRTLRPMEADARMRGAQYILDADGSALIVSRSYVVFWDGERSEVRWAYPMEQGELPRGKGAVTQQFAVIPTIQGLVVLRLADGVVIDRLDALMGNIAALDTEVLVSANSAIRSYMSWEGAYARLLKRVERHPDDPAPGLSLAFLALDRSENDGVIEGLGFALQAVDRMPLAQARSHRQRVFDGMRGMVAGQASDDALRDRLFDLMATTAQTAAQSAAYHIERGRYLAQVGGYEQAVRHFQSVMVDPVLAAAAYGKVNTTGTSPAGASAQRDLLALVREQGRAIYRRYDALAKQELESLLAQGDAPPNPDALARIAKRYPLALSASRALLIAAEQLELAGEPIGALSQYQQALASAMTPDQRQSAAGALLSFYEKSQRPIEAIALLRRLARENNVIQPLRAGQPARIEQWRVVFSAIDRRAGVAIDPPQSLASPIILSGRLLLPPPGLDPAALNGTLLVHTGDGMITRLDADQSVLWTTPIVGRQLYALADDQGQLLVWSVDTRKLIALDSATGATLWDAPADLSILEDASANAGARRVLPDALPWVHVGPSVVCFTSRTGRVMGVDRYRGELRWSVDTGIARVTAFAADPWTIVVAGVFGRELNLDHGKLVLLDMYTGNPLLPQVDLHVGFMPQIVGLDAGQVIAVAKTNARVTLFDIATGETIWQQALSGINASPQGIARSGVLAIEDVAGMIHTMRLGDDRAVVARFRLAAPRSHDQVVMRRLDDGLMLFGPQGAVAIQNDGTLRWRSAPHTGQGALHQALVGDSRIALIASVDLAGNPDLLIAQGQAVTYRLDMLSRDTGLLERSYTLGPIRGQLDPRRAVLTRAGIAIDMGTETLLLPPADADSPDPNRVSN